MRMYSLTENVANPEKFLHDLRKKFGFKSENTRFPEQAYHSFLPVEEWIVDISLWILFGNAFV